MGFRLPVIGYVAPRGVGGERAPNNAWNRQNRDIVQHVIDSLETIYEHNRDDGNFSHGRGRSINNPFLCTFLEKSRSDRSTLRDVFTKLSAGGFIVTPNIDHITDGEDMSKEIIQGHMAIHTGFLFADDIVSMRIENMDDIVLLTDIAMTNRRSVENSIAQLPDPIIPVRRRRR